MPHPGMRAMGEMKKQAAETKGSGRGGGIMSMVLPLYAVGIVVYMVYTLVKVSRRTVFAKEACSLCLCLCLLTITITYISTYI